MIRLDIIYGLSRSGKTTLCKSLTDAYYFNLGENPKFHTTPMHVLIKEEFDHIEPRDYYITEACLYDFSGRNFFINIINHIIKPDELNVFYLKVEDQFFIDLGFGKERLEKNKNILKTMKIGSLIGNHFIIPPECKSIENRVNFILNKGIIDNV
jgi:GTPase SAR1 family protein